MWEREWKTAVERQSRRKLEERKEIVEEVISGKSLGTYGDDSS